jgi:hypothetical protein
VYIDEVIIAHWGSRCPTVGGEGPFSVIFDPDAPIGADRVRGRDCGCPIHPIVTKEHRGGLIIIIEQLTRFFCEGEALELSGDLRHHHRLTPGLVPALPPLDTGLATSH